MDKIGKIKRLVESSLDTSFGGEILIKDLVVLPTHKFDEGVSDWVPDSYTIFLSVQDKRPDKSEFYHYVSDDPRYKLSNLLESLLGFECCVDFV